jgi:hypothetical protein
LAVTYYWGSADVIPDIKDLPPIAYEKAQEAANILSQNINFFVIDMAETQSGDWILIEANDGQMSGLNGIDPDVLYSKLKEKLPK